MPSTLRIQVLLHGGSRLASGLLSFYLFGLISKLYAPGEVRHLYLFLFVFGFAAAALRTLGNVSAGLDPSRTRTDNLRRLQTAMGEVLIACMLIVPLVMWLLAQHVPALWLLALAAATLTLAAIDTDMLRGLLRKNAGFSVAFALGSALAVLLLVLQDGRSPELAIVALLSQWAFVGLGSVRLIVRMLRKSLVRAIGRLREDFSILMVLTVVALFDGIVLNLPFFLGSQIALSTGLQIAVVIRLFSASLVFFPLVLHWSSSDQLHKLAGRFSVRPQVGFLCLQFLASSLCGSAFAVLFFLVAQRSVSLEEMLAFYLLALSFCTYATLARFGASQESTPRLALALAATAGVLWFGIGQVASWPDPSALTLAVMQSAALLVGAMLIRHSASRRLRTGPPGA